MTDRDIIKKIEERIDSYENDMVALQIALTAIPALAPENGGDGEYKKAGYLEEYLNDMKFDSISRFDAPDERVSSNCRPNIIVNIPGENPERTVWILTHTDVVPPGELKLWNSDPYKGHVKDGRIYGRGMEDNQQDLVASIFAAKAFVDESITPRFSVGLAFVADEETSSRKGLGYLLGMEKKIFRKDDIIVVPDFGNEKGAMIEVAEKSLLWLRFRTVGMQCHASEPSLGRNAFVAASHLVAKLGDLYHMFDAIDPLYYPPTSTFEPTSKAANVPNINTIPGEDVFHMDCRILPQYDLDEVMSKVRAMADEVEKTFDVSIEIAPVQRVQAPPPTDSDAPVVNALKKAIKEVYGVDASPAGIGGGTVAAHLRKEGYPAAVWSRLDRMAHQPNESCAISNMMGNAKVFARLFLGEY
ncbi:MAG: M20 family metallo-hydrolase [Deltaproteobacteria bacterium]|nr:M20 family metallo-hydrolase [Deltaproteobacteria bacterium]